MKKWWARRREGQILALAQHVLLLMLNIYKETEKAHFPEMSVLVLLLFYTKEQVVQHMCVTCEFQLSAPSSPLQNLRLHFLPPRLFPGMSYRIRKDVFTVLDDLVPAAWQKLCHLHQVTWPVPLDSLTHI